MSQSRRTHDTANVRYGGMLSVGTRLTTLALVAALATAGVNFFPGSSGSALSVLIATGLAILLMVALAFQIRANRAISEQVLEPVDEINSRLRKTTITGVNNTTPLDGSAAPELKDIWGHYRDLAVAAERSHHIAEVAMDAVDSRQRTAVEAAEQAETERAAGEIDELTKLFNRKRMDTDLEHAVTAIARGYADSFAFVMADVDHFKKYNDEFGHQRGDEILRQMGQILKESIRSADTAYRYGGEEFAVILRQVDPAALSIVVERLRANVEKGFAATGSSVTASFGVALSPVCGNEVEVIIKAADTALYQSKENGRNRATLADSRPSAATGSPIKAQTD